MHSNGLARTNKRQRNGFQNTPLAAPIAALAAPEPKAKPKGPQTWSTALEVCRKALGWSIPEFIANVFKNDPNIQPNDVRRWEAARATPSIAQCQKIRAALPRIFEFDDLLPLDRRAVRGMETPRQHPVPVQLAGWPGPKVATFGEALKWCRINAGQSQPDLGMLVGCRQMQISRWERDPNVRVIKDMYNRLCEVYPALEYAPKPEFSQKFQNIIKKTGYLEAEAHRIEAARYTRELDEAEEARQPTRLAHVSTPAKPVAPVLDPARLNAAGAAYGVAKATLMGLRAEESKLQGKHSDEQAALLKRQEAEGAALKEKIAAAEGDVREAEARVDQEAFEMHVGSP